MSWWVDMVIGFLWSREEKSLIIFPLKNYFPWEIIVPQIQEQKEFRILTRLIISNDPTLTQLDLCLVGSVARLCGN